MGVGSSEALGQSPELPSEIALVASPAALHHPAPMPPPSSGLFVKTITIASAAGSRSGSGTSAGDLRSPDGEADTATAGVEVAPPPPATLDPDRHRIVGSIRAAAEALLEDWSEAARGSLAYRDATRACRAALARKGSVAKARKAFLEAAVAAGIFIREGQWPP